MYKISTFVLLVVLFFSVNLYAQLKPNCAFFSKKGWDSRDSLLIEQLKQDYNVSVLNSRDIYNEVMSVDTLYNFDFTFISESVSSWPWEGGDGPKMRSIPIPMLLLEGWLSKPEVLGWTTANADTGYGSLAQDSTQLGEANKVLIIDDTGHELSAGFSYGSEVTLVSGSDDGDILTFCVPEIDYIPIAVSKINPERTIVMGVEAGTTVWNKDGTVLGESDSTVTKSRTSMIGIFASANDYITNDGFTLIESGIDWVLNQPPTEEFLNKSFTPQTGRFMIEFNAKPSAEKVDGFIGLSKDAATGYSDPVVDLLFNNEGFITAKNGDTYTSDNSLAYEANKNYVCKLVIDVPNSVYSVWVTPEGGDEILVGENYAFVSATDALGWITTKMSFDPQWGGAEGLVYVTGLKISDAPSNKLKCAFFSKKGWDSRDSLLVEKLKIDYDVSILNARGFDDGSFKIDSLNQFDFAFVSESVSSWPWEYGEGPGIRSIPIPVLLLEGWLSKPEVLGWTTASADTGYGSLAQDSTQLGEANKVLIIDDTGHALSAGFSYGSEVTLVEDSYDQDILTFCVPEIDYIPIAVSKINPERTIVMGVEEGTTVWNKAGTVLGESDSTVTKSRTAMIGIFADANDFITDDGFKLIYAGINWILHNGPDAISDDINTVPEEFTLRQNYPNPFNPSTEIVFNLKQAAQTTLSVFNVLGQKVATLVDKKLTQGQYQVTFDAANLTSGVYFYELKTDNHVQVKKMMLMK